MSRPVLLWALLLSGPAWAQGIDATGPTVLPSDGDPTRPVRVASPWRLPAGQLALGVQAAWDQGSLVQHTSDASGHAVEALVDHGLGLYLSGVWAPHDRVRVAAGVPFRWAITGDPHALQPGLGDAALAVEGSLVRGGAGELAITPWMRLPTGDANRHAGAAGPRFGGVMSGAWHGPGIHAVAELGLETQPRTDLAVGGASARGGAALTWQPSPWWALGIGSRAAVPLSDEMRRERGLPAELIASGRFRRNAWWAHAGVGRGLSSGAGSPAWSAFAGAGATLGRRPVPDVIAPTRTLTAVDPAGLPVRGAVVRTDTRTLGKTDAWGRFAYADTGDLGTLIVEAPALRPATVAAPLQDHTDIEMAWAPIRLEAKAVDVQGAPVVATFTLAGDEVVELAESGPGRVWADLPPGTWTLRMTAPGMSSQERTILAPAGRTEPIHADAVLHASTGQATMVLTVSDPDGRAVDGAQVLLDGASLGSTSTGGDLRVSDVAPLAHTLDVNAESHDSAPRRTVVLSKGAPTPVAVNLAFAPGTVRIVATGPDGAVVDGEVRLVGPVAMSPMPLGEDGERLVVLEPGRWVAVLSSPALGMQERVVEVTEDGPVPLEVHYALQPSQSGDAELLVRVSDRDGRAIDGAEVVVDGTSYGRTASGGQLRLHELRTGGHLVAVAHDGMRQPVPMRVQLTGGPHEVPVVLDWDPGTLLVRVTAAAGGSSGAVITLSGPDGKRTEPVGTSGTRVFRDLTPGTWEVLVSAPDQGMQARTVELSDSGGALAEVDVQLQRQATAAGELHLSITDPDGNPVEAALVTIDGQPIGKTSNTGEMTLWGIQVGVRGVGASGAGVTCAPTRAAVPAGNRVSVTLACGWAPGLVHIRALSPRGPVSDGLIRASGPGTVVVPLATDGERTLELEPGHWRILVSSPTAGMAEQEIRLTPERRRRVVEVELGGSQGTAQLLIRLMDDRGRPAGGVPVRVDGASAGRSRSDGTFFVPDRAPGDVTIEVPSPAFEAVPPIRRVLEPGATEQLVQLTWKPIPVRVSTRGPDGAPVAATVSAVGPARVAPATLDGEGDLYVPPGDWRVVVAAPGLAASAQPLHVGTDLPPQQLWFELSEARVDLASDALRVRDVRFAIDATDASPEYDALLAEVAALMLANPWILRLEVQGHTDATGDGAYNVELSHRRAEGIRQALTQLGVPRDRLQARGYGPTRPVRDNTTPQGRAANRRVELVILEGAETADP